ncbi:MAG: hypothetical protein JSR77_15855 [Planctomycetes bacterium]|nr:hypothetical protein [Planctomycetota bacterium]
MCPPPTVVFDGLLWTVAPFSLVFAALSRAVIYQRRADAAEISLDACRHCGYPREGLGPEAGCPECGGDDAWTAQEKAARAIRTPARAKTWIAVQVLSALMFLALPVLARVCLTPAYIRMGFSPIGALKASMQGQMFGNSGVEVVPLLPLIVMVSPVFALFPSRGRALLAYAACAILVLGWTACTWL